MLTYLVIGLVAGSIVSCWQGFKDPPWEGFVPQKFVRSIGVGGVLGVIAFWLVGRGTLVVDNLGLLLLSILATERLVGETYKGFLRRGRPHPEYMKLLSRLGIPVERGIVKVLFGVGFLVGGLYLYWLFGRLGGRIIAALGPGTAAGLLLGGAAGTLVAIGGAMKDSQFEGFKPKKFVRSPIMAALGTVWLIHLSASPLLISIGAIGFERVAVEFYKTFLIRQVRGIHADKPLAHPEWMARRWIFAVGFCASVTACVAWLVRGA